MNNGDITPFFRLKDAVKIIKKQSDREFFNIKNLISIALIYDLKLYVKFYGHWDIQVDINSNLDPEKHKQLEDAIETLIEVETLMGVFFELSVSTIKKILNKKKPYYEDHIGFTGYQPINNTLISPIDSKVNLLEQLKRYENVLSHSFSEGELKEIEILSIYPTLTYENLSKDHFPRKINSYEDMDDEICFIPDPILSDIYITKSEFDRLLTQELNPRYGTIRADDVPRQIRKKLVGTSIEKQSLIFAAKILANYLWTEDKDKKIKISEMATTIKVELIKSEYGDCMPETTEAIHEWIKGVASKYPHARKGGRPPKG